MSLIECVPNVSDGRPQVVEAIARAIRTVSGARLLDCSADPSHNRSVFTFAGDAPALASAVTAMFERAIADIDLRTHRGEHPRVGAVDVVPFVPLEGATMSECVALARRVGEAVADRFHVPVYLYEEAATAPARRHLENIRRGEFEGLAEKMKTADWAPDFGPAAPHPTAGASVIGARTPLIAFNVNLATDRFEVAKAIASKIRQRGGGLPFVKALGLRLADRGLVQVSMNLTNFKETPITRAFEAVKREAEANGVGVLESEIVGLVPSAALSAEDAREIQLTGAVQDKTIESRLRGS